MPLLEPAPPDWESLLGGSEEAAWLADRNRKFGILAEFANAYMETADLLEDRGALSRQPFRSVRAWSERPSGAVGSMADVMTPEQRSRCMSAVRDRDTKPEVRLRKALWHRGLRYRLRYKLPGKPDLVFPGPKVAVFVDGCFWHGCPVHGQTPKSNRGFWATKLSENVERDGRTNYRLRGMGWTVLRIWEHELDDGLQNAADQIEAAVRRERRLGGEPNSAAD